MVPAQPLAESSVSAYEKPPTKMIPRNESRLARPLTRSDIVMSHGSIPPANAAAAISRSPLEPSSRMTATRTLSVASSFALAVNSGLYGRAHFGAVRVACTACSASTHSSAHCSRSSANAVASHTSRIAAVLPDTATLPATETEMSAAAVVLPITDAATPAAAYLAATESAWLAGTSRMRPSSSAKSAANTLCGSDAGVGKSATTPQLPANAISMSVVTMPPSLMSWPAAMTPSSMSACVVSHMPLRAADVTSGESLPIWRYACASAEPPRRRRPAPRSTCTSAPPSPSFKSGVTTLVMSGQLTYAETTRLPGAITTSPPAAAAIDNESLPPSHAIFRSIITSLSDSAMSYIDAPSLAILAAYIQLTEARTSGSDVALANTRLVSASPTARRAMALGLIKPLRGCSPRDVARPVTSWCDCAKTATSASGSCSGPTHCCCATRPVT
mmetsp:Transcript_42935/g.128887  ORF Transcript_42935/g.128887 Transcript_42935/m.128887 type:complete len:445 (+) Transcript_42935:1310-2644(+)